MKLKISYAFSYVVASPLPQAPCLLAKAIVNTIQNALTCSTCNELLYTNKKLLQNIACLKCNHISWLEISSEFEENLEFLNLQFNSLVVNSPET